MAQDSSSRWQNLSQENLQNVQQKTKENRKDMESWFQDVQNPSPGVLGEELKSA